MSGAATTYLDCARSHAALLPLNAPPDAEIANVWPADPCCARATRASLDFAVCGWARLLARVREHRSEAQGALALCENESLHAPRARCCLAGGGNAWCHSRRGGEEALATIHARTREGKTQPQPHLAVIHLRCIPPTPPPCESDPRHPSPGSFPPLPFPFHHSGRRAPARRCGGGRGPLELHGGVPPGGRRRRPRLVHVREG